MSLPKWFSSLIAMAICFMLSIGTVSAASSDGLTLTSSTVVDGDSNLSVRPIIELEFSGKVDDITILEQNKNCFHLQDSVGNVLTLEVIFPDVQLQTRLVKHVFLKPKTNLIPGATYTLTIDQSLSDKKLHTLTESYQIHFTTGTDEVYARGAENEDLTNLGDNILIYETALAPNSVAATRVAAETETTEKTEQNTSPSTSTILPIAIAVLVIVLIGVGYWNYRTSRRSSTAE